MLAIADGGWVTMYDATYLMSKTVLVGLAEY
jgi:hypothetical protein